MNLPPFDVGGRAFPVGSYADGDDPPASGDELPAHHPERLPKVLVQCPANSAGWPRWCAVNMFGLWSPATNGAPPPSEFQIADAGRWFYDRLVKSSKKPNAALNSYAISVVVKHQYTHATPGAIILAAAEREHMIWRGPEPELACFSFKRAKDLLILWLQDREEFAKRRRWVFNEPHRRKGPEWRAYLKSRGDDTPEPRHPPRGTPPEPPPPTWWPHPAPTWP